MTDTRSSEITVTSDARQVIADMHAHVGSLARYYGEASKEYREASQSLAHVMAGMWQWQKLTVTKDMANLSLYCNGGGIHFGIIFHPVRRGCTNKDCQAVINDDGTAWTYLAGWAMCKGEHTLSYPLDAPMPGTWSFHS